MYFQDVLVFDMRKFEFVDFEVPEKLEGEYKLYNELTFLINGKVHKDCYTKRGEISHF